jgi:hypothetical protein
VQQQQQQHLTDQLTENGSRLYVLKESRERTLERETNGTKQFWNFSFPATASASFNNYKRRFFNKPVWIARRSSSKIKKANAY